MSIVCSTQQFPYRTRDLAQLLQHLNAVLFTAYYSALLFFFFVCFGSFFPFVSVPMGYLFLRKATGNAY